MISSSDSEDEYEKTPAVVLEAVLEDVIEPLLKLKVENGHGKKLKSKCQA